jgi:hypothetical protein
MTTAFRTYLNDLKIAIMRLAARAHVSFMTSIKTAFHFQSCKSKISKLLDVMTRGKRESCFQSFEKFKKDLRHELTTTGWACATHGHFERNRHANQRLLPPSSRRPVHHQTTSTSVHRIRESLGSLSDRVRRKKNRVVVVINRFIKLLLL